MKNLQVKRYGNDTKKQRIDNRSLRKKKAGIPYGNPRSR